MRKIVAALFLLLLLTGCSAAQYPDSEFLGSWQAQRGEMGGVNVNMPDIRADIVLTLEDSGKAVLTLGDIEHEGKWSPQEDDKGILLVVDDETIELAKIRDGALKGPLEGVTMTFTLKGTSEQED